MQYYKPVSIPNFEKIQKDLFTFLEDKFVDQSVWCYYDMSFLEIERFCPELHNWLINHSKFPIMFYRVYNTPPNGKFNMHIDGGAIKRCLATLNIPISGCRNSITYWWDETNAVMQHWVTNEGFGATKILNPTELKCLDKIEVNCPTLIRSDIIHSVENPNTIPRLCLAVRWILDTGIDFENILIE